MKSAKQYLEEVSPSLCDALCKHLLRSSVVSVMEDYAREIQVEAIRLAADRVENGSGDTIEDNRESILSLIDELK